MALSVTFLFETNDKNALIKISSGMVGTTN